MEAPPADPKPAGEINGEAGEKGGAKVTGASEKLKAWRKHRKLKWKENKKKNAEEAKGPLPPLNPAKPDAEKGAQADDDGKTHREWTPRKAMAKQATPRARKAKESKTPKAPLDGNAKAPSLAKAKREGCMVRQMKRNVRQRQVRQRGQERTMDQLE